MGDDEWVHFQMGGIGPMFGQVGFFHKFAGKDYEDKRPRDRYVAEFVASALREREPSRQPAMVHGRRIYYRLCFDARVDAQPGWFDGARELVDFDSFKHVPAWLERGLARPAVQRGLNIPKRD